MIIKWILFSVFILIFIATAVITLLGIIQKVNIKPGYLKALFAALILELIGATMGIFQTTDFYDSPEITAPSINSGIVKTTVSEDGLDKVLKIISGFQGGDNEKEVLTTLIQRLPPELQRSSADDVVTAIQALLEKSDDVSEFIQSMPLEIQ